MMVGIWLSNSNTIIGDRWHDMRKLNKMPIESLAELIDPMAAVAWDRDMGDCVLIDNEELGPLRFDNVNGWQAFTGKKTNLIASWDNDDKLWRR